MSYVDDAFYRDLVAQFSGWQEEDRRIEDAALRERLAALLHREARLLDQGRFEDWLGLFSADCLYWVPGSPDGDPRREVAICFDDRRRLEDRIFRLRTGYAWSQVPASRTVRHLTNMEVFRIERFPGVMMRSNFSIAELRAGERRSVPGWTAHHLVEREGRWQIRVKQVNLLEVEQNLRNLSFIL